MSVPGSEIWPGDARLPAAPGPWQRDRGVSRGFAADKMSSLRCRSEGSFLPGGQWADGTGPQLAHVYHTTLELRCVPGLVGGLGGGATLAAGPGAGRGLGCACAVTG